MSAPLLPRLLPLLGGFLFLAPLHSAQRDSTFMQEFRRLMAIHAQEDMAALLKKNEPAAVLAVIEICEAIGSGSNDVLEEEIAALDKAWRKAHGSKFVDSQYRYFSLDLQPAYKRHRKELIERFLIKRREFDGAVEAKEQGKFAALGLEFDGFGDAFSELGDHYMASQCYRTYAVCFDDGVNGTTKADYKRACEGWGLFLAERERIDLKDATYNEVKVRFDKLEFDGHGDPSKGPEARATAKAAADTTYQPRPLALTFELVGDIESIQRPLYTADSNFQIWTSVALQGVDSSGTIPTLVDSPAILRTGSSKVAVDVDGDGAGDVDIPLTGKPVPVLISLGSGDQQRSWGFLATIGQQQDTYQGFRYNTGPDDNQMSLYVAPAASLVGTIEGVRVQIFDDTLDGRYGGEPRDWGYPGLLEGAFQHDVDSILLGEAKVARPWSGLQKIGANWFKMETNESGTEIVATRTDVETGTLQLDMKGLPMSWLIVRSTGQNNGLFYDVANGGSNKVEVPVGTYQLFSGAVAQGKKAQAMKALVLAGQNTRTWSVSAGATTKVELGEPFTFQFKVEQNDESVTVPGPSIAVVGRGGETYQRLWNCVLTPELNLRKAGSSKGKKEAKLMPVQSQEELEDQKFDFAKVWFPMSATLEKNIPGESYEVQLFEKKHKLFGKIESDWKAD